MKINFEQRQAEVIDAIKRSLQVKMAKQYDVPASSVTVSSEISLENRLKLHIEVEQPPAGLIANENNKSTPTQLGTAQGNTMRH